MVRVRAVRLMISTAMRLRERKQSEV